MCTPKLKIHLHSIGKLKYSGANLIEHVQDFCAEKCPTLIMERKLVERYTMFNN